MKEHWKLRGGGVNKIRTYSTHINEACYHGPFIPFDCPIMQNTVWHESSLLTLYIHGMNIHENNDTKKQEIEIQFDTSLQLKYFNILISI